MRCFLGIPVDDISINSILSYLSGFADLRIVKPENVHMTMIFFGEIDEAEANRIKGRLMLFSYGESVEMHLIGPVCFPSSKKCRIIAMEDLNQDTSKLYASILENISEDPEKRPFRAHVTLARSRRLFSGKLDTFHIKFRARRLILYRSNLKPSGAEYEELGEVQLM